MHEHVKTLMLVSLGAGLAACGGRAANLTPTVNAFDNKLSCSHLFGEHQNLDKRLVELTGERGDKSLNNAGMLLVSPLFLDLSQTEKKEAESVVNRQQRLGELMQAKPCPQYDAINAVKNGDETLNEDSDTPQ